MCNLALVKNRDGTVLRMMADYLDRYKGSITAAQLIAEITVVAELYPLFDQLVAEGHNRDELLPMFKSRKAELS
jgi:hypothetical protein